MSEFDKNIGLVVQPYRESFTTHEVTYPCHAHHITDIEV